MKKLREASQRAAADTAKFMTHQIRSQATAAGWDADVVKNVHVEYDGKSYSTKVHPDYAERAFVHEYGNGDSKPTAVLRKFSSDTQTTERAFLQMLSHHYGRK